MYLPLPQQPLDHSTATLLPFSPLPHTQGLEPFLHQQSTIEDCVSMLDDLIGPAPAAEDLAKGKGADPANQMDVMER